MISCPIPMAAPAAMPALMPFSADGRDIENHDLGIDQAGNIWSLNNWKPRIDIDTIGMNPGGDGIIIFVGLAPPPTTQVH